MKVAANAWSPIRYLHALAAQELCDGELLNRYAARGDEDAFAELVRRHGPLVFRTCRHVVGETTVAEDAFQATFLLLARKARRLNKAGSLAGWLHGVALRTARHAVRADRRRRFRELARVKPASIYDVTTWREVREQLDTELGALPDKYREPLVLCYLQELTYEEAARRLACSVGALRGRLERGKVVLRKRLARYGLPVAAPLLALGKPAAVSATLLQATLATVRAGVTGAAISPAVAALVGGSAWLKGLAVSLIVVVAATGLAFGLGGIEPTPAKEPAPLPGVVQPGPAPEPKKDAQEDLLPPGAIARLGTTQQRTVATALQLAPDGRTLFTVTGGCTIGRWDPETGRLRDEFHLDGPPSERCWFAPDGRSLAVPEGKAIGLWDLTTGKRQRLLAVNDASAMTHVAFAPEGKLLATAEFVSNQGLGKGFIRVWSTGDDGNSRLIAELPSYANALAFSPDGRRLYAAVDNHSLRCWDVATGKQLWQNDHWATKVVVSPDGKTLVTDRYQKNGSLYLWDAASGDIIHTIDCERTFTAHLTFAPDGKTVAQGTEKGVYLWDVKTRKLERHFKQSGPQMLFSADGKSLFTLGYLLERWDVASGKLFYADTRTQGHLGPVKAVTFTPDGQSVATSGIDGTLRLWNRATGQQRLLRNTPARRLWGIDHYRNSVKLPDLLEFTPDGRLFLNCEGFVDTSLTLFATATGKEASGWQLPKSNRLVAARLTADGRTLAALGNAETPLRGGGEIEQSYRKMQHTLILWDVTTGREVIKNTIAVRSAGGHAAFSPDGRFLVREFLPELHEVRSGKVRALDAANHFIGSPMAFSPDGRFLAIAEPGKEWNQSKGIGIYEVLTGRQLSHVEAALGLLPALAFSPDGRLLATPDKDALAVWEVSTGKSVLHLPVRGRLTNWIGTRFAECLAFAPDGRTLATGHADGAVLVWDLAPAWKNLTISKKPVDTGKCWTELAAADPKVAWPALEGLVSAPGQTLPLLREHLHPVKIEARWLADRLANLDSPVFKTRETATKDLKQVAEAVEIKLRDASAQAATEEVRRRLDSILAVISPAVPPAGTLRSLRALTVLERIGTPEARALLTRLCARRPSAPLTREAVAALRRLEPK